MLISLFFSAIAALLTAAQERPVISTGPGAGEEATPRYVAPPPPRPEAPIPKIIPSYFDLTPQMRAEMPDLELSMIRYDPKPEERFVILNGIRAAEGLPAGRDLWIHEIRRQDVVLKYIDQYFLLKPR